MLAGFELSTRFNPDYTCFIFSDAENREDVFSFREMRMLAAATARVLQDEGVQQNDCVVVDLPNCQALVLLVLAAAYGGFTLVLLDNHSSAGQKLSVTTMLENNEGVFIAAKIDKSNKDRLQGRVLSLFSRTGSFSAAGGQHGGVSARIAAAKGSPRSKEGQGRANPGRDAIRRREEEHLQENIESVMHFAEHRSRMFRQDDRAVILASRQRSGASRLVPLTWRQLGVALDAFDWCFGEEPQNTCQIALPLSQVDSLRALVHCFKTGSSFVLYERYDAEKMLADISGKGVNRLVLDNSLLGMMVRRDAGQSLRRYRAIIVSDVAHDMYYCRKAFEQGASLYVGYGVVETGGQVAFARFDDGFKGGLALLPGYSSYVTDEGEDGFGNLVVRGPSVFDGYLEGASPLFSGSFTTGDKAALKDGLIYVQAHFGKGSEAQSGRDADALATESLLLQIPGIEDAFVLSVSEGENVCRHVAFVKRSQPCRSSVAYRAAFSEAADYISEGDGQKTSEASVSGLESMSNYELAGALQLSLASHVPKNQQPDYLFVLDEFPYDASGRVDLAELEKRFEHRMDVKNIRMATVKPLTLPGAQSVASPEVYRDGFIVQLFDGEGRKGIGERVPCVLSADSQENQKREMEFMRTVLIPLVLRETFLHPDEMSRALSRHEEAREFPQVCAAFEMALWDLHGQVVKRPLWRILRESCNPAFLQELDRLSGLRSAATQRHRSYYAKDLRNRRRESSLRRRGRALDVNAAEVGGVQPLLNCIGGALQDQRRVRLVSQCGLGVVKRVHNAFRRAFLVENQNQMQEDVCLRDVTRSTAVPSDSVREDADFGKAYGLGCDIDQVLLDSLTISSLECISG